MHSPSPDSGHFLDLEHWPRQAHYNFFKSFADPYYNMCAEVDVTRALDYCQRQNVSFFHLTLYLSIKAANQVEEFRYRICGDRVWVYDRIHPSCTLLNDDHTFSFCDFEYVEGFSDFDACARQAREQRYLPPQEAGPGAEREDVIHYSVIPWLSFTNFTHPKLGKPGLSVPKFGFGKYQLREKRWMMPVSVDVNHMFVDGYHIGRFFQSFQTLLDDVDAV